MVKAHKIPLGALFAAVLLVAVGELAAGTDLYFVTMVAIALVSAGLTYNMLGGLSTISGIGFCGFALNGLVIGQIAKVLLFEPADHGLDVPHLTITVYTVYYLSLMVGVFLFGWIRLRLPKPLEPSTSSHSMLLYAAAFGIGLPATIAFTTMNLAGGDAAQSAGHGLALALSYLLPFSIVVAVDHRIKATNGRHCFGWTALWPAASMMFLGFAQTGRGLFMQPFVIVLVTCYFRGYKFRLRHYVAAAAGVLAFFLVISPYFLYARAWRGAPSIAESASTMIRLLRSAPEQWQTIRLTVASSAQESDRGEQYFSTSGTGTLTRFTLIAPDSTLINACSQGFHYGFESIRMDVLSQIPHFLYKNKPDVGSDAYLGHLDGLESDRLESTHSTITPVPDSYGAFGWLGVILFPLLAYPAIFIIYESLFDMSRPWGTIALVTLLFALGGGTMGSTIMIVLIKTPLNLVIISRLVGWITRNIPVRGDNTRILGQHRFLKTLSSEFEDVAI